MSKIWFNGKIMDESAPILTAADRSLRGDGVFDTMLVIIHDFDPPHLAHPSAHFDRLLHNAAMLGIPHASSVESLLDAATLFMEKTAPAPGNYALNTTITGGAGERGLMRTGSERSNIFMRLSLLPSEFPPIQAVIAKSVRRNEGSPLSNLKSINYGDNILALKEAIKGGANEAILLNNRGNVSCATTGNIFIPRGKKLLTPPLSDGAAAGITRMLLIKHQIAQEHTLTPADLRDAKTVYLSNSLRGLAPIASLNGTQLETGAFEIPENFHIF